MGLSDSQFYSLTPRQYHLLLERHRDRQKHAEWLTGIIASTVANWSMGAPKEPLQPKDFPLPLLRERERLPRLNRRRVADKMRGLFKAEMERMSGRSNG